MIQIPMAIGFGVLQSLSESFNPSLIKFFWFSPLNQYVYTKISPAAADGMVGDGGLREAAMLTSAAKVDGLLSQVIFPSLTQSKLEPDLDYSPGLST